MNYQASIKKLMQQNQSVKLGLSRMQELLRLLGNPEEKLQFLHVAGTNGKGSTCAFLDAILKAGGISRGRFTSPHLHSIRERILINGEMITEDQFIELFQQIDAACKQMQESPSFFECITAIAFLAFKQASVIVVILEVGLGGRLDATNVIDPLVCGISTIDLDHTRILGDTLGAIATEKAGIIKANKPAISSKQHDEVTAIIRAKANEVAAPFWQIGAKIHIEKSADGFIVFKNDKLILPKSLSSLKGEHQIENAALAVAMLEAGGLVADLQHRKIGVENAVWPGRYETVNNNPLVVLDGAHNISGINALIETLLNDKRLQNLPLIMILGMTDGHDFKQIINTLKQSAMQIFKIIVTKANAPRALSAQLLYDELIETGFENVILCENSELARQQALITANEIGGAVLVTGSLFLVGEIRSQFIFMPSDDVSPHY